MKTSLIVARDWQGVIGVDGKIPWHCPADMALFKQITSGEKKAIVMGRNTWDSLPVRPLPGRLNVVVTSSAYPLNPITRSASPDTGFQVVTSVVESIDVCERLGIEELIFIGGKGIYDEAVEIVDVAHISEMDVSSGLEAEDDGVVAFDYDFFNGLWTSDAIEPCYEAGSGKSLFTYHRFVRK